MESEPMYMQYRVNPPFPKIGQEYVLNGLRGFGVDASFRIDDKGGVLSPVQKAACDKAKKLLPNMPWVTSPECGVCPTCESTDCPSCDCPPPLDCDCGPSCADQGFIMPSDCDCPTVNGTLKEATEGGLAWWWLLVAAGAGIGVGYYAAKKL